jgi:hypothetical protein
VIPLFFVAITSSLNRLLFTLLLIACLFSRLLRRRGSFLIGLFLLFLLFGLFLLFLLLVYFRGCFLVAISGLGGRLCFALLGWGCSFCCTASVPIPKIEDRCDQVRKLGILQGPG